MRSNDLAPVICASTAFGHGFRHAAHVLKVRALTHEMPGRGITRRSFLRMSSESASALVLTRDCAMVMRGEAM